MIVLSHGFDLSFGVNDLPITGAITSNMITIHINHDVKKPLLLTHLLADCRPKRNNLHSTHIGHTLLLHYVLINHVIIPSNCILST